MERQYGKFTALCNLVKAIRLVEMVLVRAQEVVAGFADTRQERNWDRLVAFIKRKGEATQSTIYKYMKNVESRDLEQLLTQMVIAGEAHGVEEETRGRPRKVWRLGPTKGQ